MDIYIGVSNVMRTESKSHLKTKRPVLVAKNGPKNQESLPQNFLGHVDFRNKEFFSSTAIELLFFNDCFWPS